MSVMNNLYLSSVMYECCKRVHPKSRWAQFRMMIACYIGGLPLADAIVLQDMAVVLNDVVQELGA